MKDFLLQHGWKYYATVGCPGCGIGISKHYKNPQHEDYRVIIKGRTATLRIFGINKVVTKEIEVLKQKMIELNIINQ
jgi:hypothetical protein